MYSGRGTVRNCGYWGMTGHWMRRNHGSLRRNDEVTVSGELCNACTLGYQDRCPGQTRRNITVRIVGGVAGFLGARGRAITMATSNRRYELKAKTIIYGISFYLTQQLKFIERRYIFFNLKYRFLSPILLPFRLCRPGRSHHLSPP